MTRKRALALVFAAAILAVGYYLWGSSSTPPGQPSLVSLNEVNASQFQQGFNSAISKHAHCGAFVPNLTKVPAGASAVEAILKQTHFASLRVFVVWEPMLPTDWYRPTRPTLKRVSDSRAVQFWDKSHLIAAQVKKQLRQFHGSDPSCCENGGHLWDMAAVYPPGVKWGEGAPAFDDGPVYRIAPRLEQRLSGLSVHTSMNNRRQPDAVFARLSIRMVAGARFELRAAQRLKFGSSQHTHRS